MAKIVRVIGDGVPYLDGAEAELLEFMKNAEDRSIGSDELAAGIHDWPSMYHLSRARANLLMPFNISENHRVLDVGCGTGALTRQFAEWGSHVTGLEGSYDRSLVACERVREFENAEIVNGSLDEYASENHKEEFDVILLCGVLEYSGAIFGGSDGPDKMLASVNQMLKSDGILIIAIENQLGMKYLLGYNEDHLGTPWIGLSDYYQSNVGVRTWTRHSLKELLARNGLSNTKWFGSFPDYKIPTAVVSDDLWQLAEGKQLAKLFIREPISDHSAEPQFKADTFSFWSLMLQTENPQEFVNSHLVVASKSNLFNSKYIKDGLIWTGHSGRLKKYARKRLLSQREVTSEFVLINEFSEPNLTGQLAFNPKPKPVYVGESLEDRMIYELRGKTLAESIKVFQVWWKIARVVLDEASENGVKFDILPRNFVMNKDEWQYVDDEWSWQGNITPQVVLLRSLFYFFLERLNKLSIPIIESNMSFGELLIYFGSKLEPETRIEDLEKFILFDSMIMHTVSNINPTLRIESLNSICHTQVKEFRVSVEDLNIRTQLNHANQELNHANQELNHANQELNHANQELDAINDSFSWKLTSPIRFVARRMKKII